MDSRIFKYKMCYSVLHGGYLSTKLFNKYFLSLVKSATKPFPLKLHICIWSSQTEHQVLVLCVCAYTHAQLLSHVWLFATPWMIAQWLLCPWNSPGKKTRVGCLFFLQGIFPIQGLNPSLLRCRQTLYQLSHRGSPKIGKDESKKLFWPIKRWGSLKPGKINDEQSSFLTSGQADWPGIPN